MNSKLLTSCLTYSSLATGAYFAGTYVERQRVVSKHLQKENVQEESMLVKFSRMPGFPVSTVSAATAVATTEFVNLFATPSRVSEIMKYGFPGLDHVRSYSDFVLSYDRRNRVPHWVFEHITPESISHNDAVDRSKCCFRQDESIHAYFRSDNNDYKRSGYDRGHMAAAGNHKRHQKHCDDTFFLTNMAPQVGQGFNRDSWNRLEAHVRKLTKVYPNVYVVTGPLYLPQRENDGKNYVKYEVIGTNNVAVPTHFYKVIVGETSKQVLEMEAYVMPNKVISDDTPLEAFRVPPETIERAAGLLFFDQMNRKQLAKVNGQKV